MGELEIDLNRSSEIGPHGARDRPKDKNSGISRVLEKLSLNGFKLFTGLISMF